MRRRYRLRSAVIVVATVSACATWMLSSTDEPLTSIDTTMYLFGPVTLGSSAMSPAITVSPAGSSAMMDNDYIYQITFDTPCSDFQLYDGGTGQLFQGSGGGLYGSAQVFWSCSGSGSVMSRPPATCFPVQYQFYATFTPSSTVHQQCIARVYTHSGSGAADGSSNTVLFDGTGSADNFDIAADMTNLNFGSVLVNSTSGSQTVTIMNKGVMAVDVGGTNGDPVTFNVMPPLATPQHILPGGSQQYNVTCHPANTIGYNTMLHFKTQPSQNNLDVPVGLDCFGSTLNLFINPRPIAFGDMLVGQSPQTINVSIDAGSATVTLDSFAFAGGTSPHVTFNPPPAAPQTASPGNPGSVSVQYDPSSQDTTGSLGTLTFNANGMAQMVAITGKALTASLGTSPASVDFGPICAGTGSAQDVTIQTNAAGPVNVMNLLNATAPFGATSTDVPMQLGGNGTGVIIVHASVNPPVSTSAGPISSKFTLVTDIPNAPNRDVPLMAAVITAGLSPTPGSLSFGSVPTAGMSQSKQVIVANCGASDTILDARLTGADPGEFSIESPANAANLNKTLANGESQTFLVQMTPHSDGNKTATLLIEHNGGAIEVPLDGNSFGGSGSDMGATQRETYYACSTGRPGSLAPIALALLALRRRRR